MEENKKLFVLQTANQRIEKAKSEEIPNMLFDELWYEGELLLFFAPTNLGKTMLAMQIANAISKGENIDVLTIESEAQKVLYIDFELNDKQFENRFSEDWNNHYVFSDNLLFATINKDFVDWNGEEQMIKAIENAIIESGAKVIVIDNITFVSEDSSKGDKALALMRVLKNYKSKYGLSIMVIAHTVKRDQTRPLLKDDMAGSSNLQNFADTMMVLGDAGNIERYLKQLKARYNGVKFGEDNVIVFEIDPKGNLTQMKFKGFSEEYKFLKVIDKEQREEDIIEYKRKNPNASLREIGEHFGVGKSTVGRLLDKPKE